MTRKASPIYFEGHKIVRISDLPFAQASLFSGWVQPSSRLPLEKPGDQDCVRYEDYDYWYTNHFCAEQNLDEML